MFGTSTRIAIVSLLSALATPVFAQQRLAPREDLRLGVVNDSGPLSFHRISAITTDTRGNIYVGSGTIRMFDASGIFVREFGRAGQGPGEYRAINVLSAVGDTLVLTDWQSGGRTILYDARTGAVIDSWNATGTDGSRTFVMALTSNGWLGSVRAPLTARSGAMIPGQILRDTTRLQFFDKRTRAPGAFLRPVVSTTRRVVGAGEGGSDWPLFEPMVGAAVTPRGLQFQVPDPHAYAIEVYDATARKIRTITRPFTPSRITTAEVEKFKAMIERHYLLRPPPPGFTTLAQTLQRVDARAQMHMATRTSPFGRLLVSEDGELWVERPDLVKDVVRIEYERWYAAVNRMPGLDEPESKWDRFDTEGRFTGQVTLPANFTAMSVARGAVYGVSRDDNDVEFVVRMRVF